MVVGLSGHLFTHVPRRQSPFCRRRIEHMQMDVSRYNFDNSRRKYKSGGLTGGRGRSCAVEPMNKCMVNFDLLTSHQVSFHFVRVPTPERE